MIPTAPFRVCRLAALLIALCFATAAHAADADAGSDGLHPELGIGMNALMGLGNFGKVTDPCIGGDAALGIVRGSGGFGVRVAGGVHLLSGYSVPTGEVLYTGYGTQEGKFEAKQSLWWVAAGPAWTSPRWHGRLDTYFLVGRAIAKASSGQGWINMSGADPGSTRVAIARAGVSWAPTKSPVELGVELLMGGEAAFWGDPPAVQDSSGVHVLQSQSASVNAVVIRLGRRLWK